MPPSQLAPQDRGAKEEKEQEQRTKRRSNRRKEAEKEEEEEEEEEEEQEDKEEQGRQINKRGRTRPIRGKTSQLKKMIHRRTRKTT